MTERQFHPNSPPQSQKEIEAQAAKQMRDMIEVGARAHHEKLRSIAQAEGADVLPAWDELSEHMKRVGRECAEALLRKAMVASGPPGSAGGKAGSPEMPPEFAQLGELSAVATPGLWSTAHKYRSPEDRAFYVAAVNFARMMLPLLQQPPGPPPGMADGPPPAGKPGFDPPGGYPMRPVGKTPGTPNPT